MKASKIWACFSSGIPIPVSRTAKWMAFPDVGRTSNAISLVSKFDRIAHQIDEICRKRPGSLER